MKKSRLTKILVEGRPEFLAKWADEIEAAATVSIERAPSTGLIMLKTRDSVSKQPFYMGEVLVTECSVTVNHHAGIGIVMGDEPVRSYQIAVVDAAINAKLPIANQLIAELEIEEKFIEQKMREEAARIAKTKVQFDTMEDYNAKKANLAGFDMVHGTQRIFRKLLDCMARPGKIERITEEIEPIQELETFSRSLVGIAYTLIDQEVKFHIAAGHSETIQRALEWKTYSKGSSLKTADYVFINHPEEVENISELIQQLKKGTLTDPHDSATVVLCVKELSANMDSSSIKLTMSGPGIASTRAVYIKGLSSKWIEERNIATSEFPLGVDFILTTNCGDMMALPRTTLLESEEL